MITLSKLFFFLSSNALAEPFQVTEYGILSTLTIFLYSCIRMQIKHSWIVMEL